MGLLSKYRSRKVSGGHSRTSTASLGFGSEYLNITSESSYSSNEYSLTNDKENHGYGKNYPRTNNKQPQGSNMQTKPYSGVYQSTPSRKPPPTSSQYLESTYQQNTSLPSPPTTSEGSPYQRASTLDPGSKAQQVPIPESLRPQLPSPKVRSTKPPSKDPQLLYQASNDLASPDLSANPYAFAYPQTEAEGNNEPDRLSALFNRNSPVKHNTSELTDISDYSNKNSFKSGTVLQNMLDLSLNPNPNSQFRQISDYDRYFFHGTDDEEDIKLENVDKPLSKRPLVNRQEPRAFHEITNSADSSTNYINNTNNNNNTNTNGNQVNQIKPVQDDLLRADSSASGKSYNSIERGDSGKFRVSTTEERVKRIQSLSMQKPRKANNDTSDSTLTDIGTNLSDSYSAQPTSPIGRRLTQSQSVTNFHPSQFVAGHIRSVSNLSSSNLSYKIPPPNRNFSQSSRRASTLILPGRVYQDSSVTGSQIDFTNQPFTPQGLPRLQTSFLPYNNFSTEYLGSSKRNTFMGNQLYNGSAYTNGTSHSGSMGISGDRNSNIYMDRNNMMAGDRSSMFLPYGYGVPPNQVGGYMLPMIPKSRSSSPLRQVGGFNQQLFQNLDPEITRKIENYISLRTIIAQGNKSLEYRLKWVQMLVLLVNLKLYLFINIKGEPVTPETIPLQKQLYIKSTVNHTLRLLKECEGKEKYEEIFSDICYVYGCLLKHDYVEQYQQDFGIQKNVDEALRFFERSIEVRANNFKSYYRLGELYEIELYPTIEPREGEPDFLETALNYYKQAAQYGYNKAIYRIGLLYMNVPKFRSHRCIKYFGDLANVDTNLKEINLEEEDRDELEFVIGSAAYQMGRVYEGLYPGDLTIESEFVVKCLEIAPVNWSKALAYYNKAARLNNLLAQVRLGKVYEFGELDRQQNINKSIQWYYKASSLNNSFERHYEAMLGLTRWYMAGTNGASKMIPFPDKNKALAWCNRALELNAAEPYFQRGLLAEQGIGNEPAEQFFQIAYELGHAEAGMKLNLGEEADYAQPMEPEMEPEMEEELQSEMALQVYEYNLQEEFKI